MPPELSRRDFLATCGVLAASFAACSSAGRSARVAAAFLADPSLDDYRAPLRALIETVLPIGARDFPLTTDEVEQRLLHMYPLEDERRFMGLQRTLVYFDELDLAPHVAAPLLAAERVALDVPTRLSESDFRLVSARKTDAESQACDAFFLRFGHASRFASLMPDARFGWLALWCASEFTVKRDFAHTVRRVISNSTYSSDRIWPAIGYDGLLIERPERRS